MVYCRPLSCERGPGRAIGNLTWALVFSAVLVVIGNLNYLFLLVKLNPSSVMNRCRTPIQAHASYKRQT